MFVSMPFVVRAGEMLDSRRDPFELLHEFLDRHEIRYYEMFQRIDTEKNAFLTKEELSTGLMVGLHTFGMPTWCAAVPIRCACIVSPL